MVKRRAPNLFETRAKNQQESQSFRKQDVFILCLIPKCFPRCFLLTLSPLRKKHIHEIQKAVHSIKRSKVTKYRHYIPNDLQ